MSRRIAITGATGFVGKTAVALAVKAGWQVTALARSPQAAMENVTWVSGALDNPATLIRLTEGADAVIHIAAMTTAPNREAFEKANVAGTMNIVEATKLSGVRRFIHVSSLAARVPELSDYGWSKAKSEAVAKASGLDWTIVRPPAVYGPGDQDFLPMFKMASFGFVTLPPKGRLSVIEVSDLSRLLLELIPHHETLGEVYEPDDGKKDGWSHASFAKAIGWTMGKSIIPIHLPGFVMKVAARIDMLIRRSKARLTADRVGYMVHPDWVSDPTKQPPSHIWEPEVHTVSGLKATLNAYRRTGVMS